MYKKIACFAAALILVVGIMYRINGNNTMNHVVKINYFLTPEMTPQPALTALLTELRIPHDGTLDSIIKATQTAWLRKPGQERWHLEKQYQDIHATLMLIFTQLALIDEVQPLYKHYMYALMLGSTVQVIRIRLGYLIYLWNKGVRFDTIVMLGGQRPMDPTIENETTLLNNTESYDVFPFKQGWTLQGDLPNTEITMMRMVFDQAQLPAGFEKVPVVYIDVPMKVTADGKLARPTTGDTIAYWLATNPSIGSCLAISSQPQVNYQDTVIRTYLPKEFSVETVGCSIDNPTEKDAIILDAIARTLYQGKIVLTQNNKD